MKVDLHLHSIYSWDSLVPIENYIKRAEENDFGGIAITDHNNIESHAKILDLQEKTHVLLIPGQEISTADGHLLVYGWTTEIPAKISMKKSVEMAKKGAINGSKVICIAAHPYDKLRQGKGNSVLKTGIDGIEVLNASTLLGMYNKKAKKSKPHQMIGIGNSDSHRLSEFGTAWTEIPESKSIEEVLNNLINGIEKGSRIGLRKKTKRFLRRKFGKMSE